jgi:hypothetical protein
MRPGITRGRSGSSGVRSARDSIIESHGFACKAPAISESFEKKKKLKKVNKEQSPEFPRNTASRKVQKKASKLRRLGCPKKETSKTWLDQRNKGFSGLFFVVISSSLIES